MEKLDINEEKVRLSQHCNHFRELSNMRYPGATGFIAQEMGREINTMDQGQSCRNQRIVVMMKDELKRSRAVAEYSLNYFKYNIYEKTTVVIFDSGASDSIIRVR